MQAEANKATVYGAYALPLENKDSASRQPSHKLQFSMAFRAITCYLRGLSKVEYSMLREACSYANNLFNKGLYEVRQHYFLTGHYLRYESNYHVCKGNENYTMLHAQTAQHVLKRVDYAFKSFFALLKKTKAGEYDSSKVKLPRYREKGGLYSLVIPVEHGGCYQKSP